MLLAWSKRKRDRLARTFTPYVYLGGEPSLAAA